MFGPEEQQQRRISSLCCAESDEFPQKCPVSQKQTQLSSAQRPIPFIPLAGQHCVDVAVVVVLSAVLLEVRAQQKMLMISCGFESHQQAANILLNRLKNVGTLQRLVYQNPEDSSQDALRVLERR